MAANGSTPTAEANPSVTRRQFATDINEEVTSLTSRVGAVESGKAASSHTHAQSDVTGLVSALSGKAASSHTHAQSDVTGLVSALAFPGARGSDIAAATTTNIAAATGEYVHVTGNATITSLGASAQGPTRDVRFTGTGTLVHSAALRLPGGADIAYAPDDTATFRCFGTDSWICLSYKRASGRAIVETSVTAIEEDIAELASAVAAKADYTLAVPEGGLVYDRAAQTLFIPEFTYKSKTGALATVTPPTGKYFEAVTAAFPGNSARLIYYNISAGAVQSNTLASAHVNLLNGNYVYIATVWNGGLNTPLPVAEVVPNLVERGTFEKQYSGAGTYRVVTANSILTGLGIREVFTSADGNPSVSVRVPRRFFVGFAFMRVFVLLGDGEAENDWPATIIAYSRTRAAATSAGGADSYGTMELERVYSTRVASFVMVTRDLLSSFQNQGWSAFVTGEDSGRDISLSLPQVGYSKQPDLYVQSNDWPLLGASGFSTEHAREPNLLYSKTVYGIEGRPIVFYPMQMQLSRRESGPLTMVSCENNASDGDEAVPPLSAAGRDYIEVGAGRLATGHSVDIITAEGAPQPEWRGRVEAVSKITALSFLAGKAPKVLFLGDAITHVQPTADRVFDILRNAGAEPVGVGTIDEFDPTREGRSGIRLSDYVNKTTSLDIVNPEAYALLSNAEKYDHNPFVREEVGTETGAYNGYIFDFAWYLTVHGVAIPTQVVINLGSDDAADFDSPELFYAHVQECLGVIVPSILAADAGTKVILAAHGSQWSSTENDLWPKRGRGLISGLLNYAATLASARCVIAPAWAHMSPFDWGKATITAQRTNSLTGAKVQQMGADANFHDVALRQYAECVAAAIAGTM